MSAILLHPDDTILVVTAALVPGDTVLIDDTPSVIQTPIGVGHKIARQPLAAGETVIKYGAPIGSMTASAGRAEHVHLHNMKSDYIASHLRDTLDRSPS